MAWAIILLSALGLDLLLGDPSWLPHPVRIMGRMARWLEPRARLWIRSPLIAGIITTLCIYSASFLVPHYLIQFAAHFSPLLSKILSVYWIYSSIALRDLIDHSMRVYRALQKGSIAQSRRLVAMLVGRDTENLSEAEVVRACVESISESTVDGVTAPLFFAALGGPAWAVLYRAINTLDSLFGHRDNKYEYFGKLAARIDDLANLIPARITAPLLSLSALFILQRPLQSLKILWRDGKKHPSPNSGLAEAAVAGALGIQLGGENYYQGEKSYKEHLGEPLVRLDKKHILQANLLLLFSTFFVFLFLYIMHEYFKGAWQ